MTQALSEIMDLQGMTKDQLIGLCNALYLINRTVPVQTFISVPIAPAPPLPFPFIPTYPTWGNSTPLPPLPQGGTTVCSKT